MRPVCPSPWPGSSTGVVPLQEPPRRQHVDLVQRRVLARASQVVHVRPPAARADRAPDGRRAAHRIHVECSGGTPGRWSRRHPRWSGPPRGAGRQPRQGRRLQPSRGRPRGGTAMGAALLRRGLFRLFIGVFACGRALRCALRGDSAPTRLFSGSQPDLITAPGRFGLSPPAPPLDIRAAFCYGVVGREKPLRWPWRRRRSRDGSSAYER